jgi:hypothetical protein
MNIGNKNLFILKNQHSFTEMELKKEIEILCSILYSQHFENNFFASVEVIDVNKYKILNNFRTIKRSLSKVFEPFIFVINKN